MDISAEIIEFKVPTDNIKTLFVWNITASLSEEETYILLMKKFSEFGLLYSVNVCKNAVVAEPGFYAIVKFYSSRDASRAQRACDKNVLFQDFPLKVRLCTKQKGYHHLGCGLNSVKCQDVANHYLGFNGWSKRIIMIQNISGFDDLEDEDTEAKPEGENLKYLYVIEVALHKHGLCSRGVGVGEEKLENPKDTLEIVMKTGKTQKFAVQKALSDAFQKILLVVLENGKVAAEYSSVREEAVDCLSEEELHGLIKVTEPPSETIQLEIYGVERTDHETCTLTAQVLHSDIYQSMKISNDTLMDYFEISTDAEALSDGLLPFLPRTLEVVFCNDVITEITKDITPD